MGAQDCFGFEKHYHVSEAKQTVESGKYRTKSMIWKGNAGKLCRMHMHILSDWVCFGLVRLVEAPDTKMPAKDLI